jgi:hypothetical protein
VRVHIQKLKAPITRKPRKLGHSGIGEPATYIDGCVISLTNCARAIRPNTTHATRNPVICDLIFFSSDTGDTGPIGLIGSIRPIGPINNGANVIPVKFVSLPLESQAVVAIQSRSRVERRAEPIQQVAEPLRIFNRGAVQPEPPDLHGDQSRFQ